MERVLDATNVCSGNDFLGQRWWRIFTSHIITRSSEFQSSRDEHKTRIWALQLSKSPSNQLNSLSQSEQLALAINGGPWKKVRQHMWGEVPGKEINAHVPATIEEEVKKGRAINFITFTWTVLACVPSFVSAFFHVKTMLFPFALQQRIFHCPFLPLNAALFEFEGSCSNLSPPLQPQKLFTSS